MSKHRTGGADHGAYVAQIVHPPARREPLGYQSRAAARAMIASNSACGVDEALPEAVGG